MEGPVYLPAMCKVLRLAGRSICEALCNEGAKSGHCLHLKERGEGKHVKAPKERQQSENRNII